MAAAKQGDRVKIHYTGKLDDGSVFDSSEGRDPLQFTIGEGQVIPGFDAAVTGMSVGDEKTAHIPVGEAYGERREEMVFEVPRDEMPDGMEPEVGQQLNVRHESGESATVMVTVVDGDTITLDANHPLAGEDLVFELELVAIA